MQEPICHALADQVQPLLSYSSTQSTRVSVTRQLFRHVIQQQLAFLHLTHDE